MISALAQWILHGHYPIKRALNEAQVNPIEFETTTIPFI